MFCLCFVIFVFFVVRKLAIVLNWGFPDNHLIKFNLLARMNWEISYMTQSFPSIFNDVIGPVMRGPSSSHCAASLRIGRLARDLMEVKSAMGVVVAAPTAGSCGTLPGACLGAADFMGLEETEIARALLAAGLIGVFIAARSTFAAEEAGCQAECGVASGMAAAALVSLAKGSLLQAVCASSMALQNILGMVCDPVANRVEVPCLGKNVMAVSNALSCANMALAGFDQVIPLDEVIAAMDAVGRSIPRELRCTALGGLSATRTAREIDKKLSVRG